jgi:7,8-dihydropterin-6-yl-methyl-4-(beta-D-ribofuranosyl)aminobenzene 5'-phosphate synthase
MKTNGITFCSYSLSVFIFGIVFNHEIYSLDRRGENKAGLKSENPGDEIKITILYDNYIAKQGTQSDWGFACLIEGLEQTILFDTGTKEEILLANCQKLGVDLSKPEILFLSHNHGDHTGGILKVLELNPKINVFVPKSFPENFADKNQIKNFIRILSPQKICSSAFSTGELGNQIKEQSLVLDTQKGLIVITGCSHPGIVEILRKVKSEFKKDIYLVIGGFHLLQYSNEAMEEIISNFQELGIVKCGATHCTGEKQIQLLEKFFSTDYIKMGTGQIIIINSDGLHLQ